MRRSVALRWARNPWLAVLLLGAIFTRALIPIGYMPGGAGVMLCPGYAATAGGAAHSAGHQDMPGMDMSDHGAGGMDHGGKSPGHEGMGFCPSGAAVTVFTLSQALATAAYAPIVKLNVRFVPGPLIPQGTVIPTRLPRGPPAFR